jgi:uncharacterized protein YggE
MIITEVIETANQEGIMEQRIITVKGVGKASVKPDMAVISLTVERQLMDYESSVKEAAEAVAEIISSLAALGFEKSDLKTTDWDSEQVYEQQEIKEVSLKGRRNKWKDIFVGYKTKHDLKLEFMLADKKISEVIATLANCSARPEFSTRFSIKDKDFIADQVLRDATMNALKTAKLIVETAGEKLGKAQRIDYNWSEYHYYSETRFGRKEAERYGYMCEDEHCYASNIDIEPEEINLRDTITFLWEIE